MSDEAELSKVVSLYEAGMYGDCAGELERLLDPTGRTPLRQPTIIANARIYWAACLIGGGTPERADAPLRAAIHEDPQMKPPDSLVFPQPVVERFFRVRDQLVNEIRAAEQLRFVQAQEEARRREKSLEVERSRIRELERLAGEETVIIKNRRLFSFIPFGVGQLQNGRETLGYTLMVSELALLGTSVASVAIQSQLAADAADQQDAGNEIDESQANSRKNAWGTVRTVSFWSFASVALLGVLHAQLDYQAEFREVRRRKVPASATPNRPAPAGNVSAVPFGDRHSAGIALSAKF